MNAVRFLSHLRRLLRTCISDSCQEGNCRLGLASFDRRKIVIVCGSLYQKLHSFEQPLCDCIVFSTDGSLTVAAVELKDGKLRTDAVAQIENGAALAEEIVAGYRHRIAFYAMTLHAGGAHPIDRKVFDRRKINFRGGRYSIWVNRCGAELASIIKH